MDSNKMPKETDSIYYHKHCVVKAEHSVCYQKTPQVPPNYASFTYVTNFVQLEVVRKQNVYLFSDVFEIYKEHYNDINDENQKLWRKDHLLQKLKQNVKHLRTTIIKKNCIIYSSNLQLSELCTKLKLIQDNSSIRAASYAVREKIMKMKRDSHVPPELVSLILSIIRGPKPSKNSRIMKKVRAISDFIVNCTTRGKIRTKTCVGLGLVVKSKTGSKELIEILNKLGVSISYSLVDEIETELAYHESNASILPMGVKARMPNLCTGVAFDNYDRYVETATGRDTLHDTVGIVYQNISAESNDINFSHLDLALNVSQIQDRRRKYESSFDKEIPIYFKRNKTFPVLSDTPINPPPNFGAISSQNDIWMMNFAFDFAEAKQWNAWNAQFTTDSNPQQIVAYLPQLNSSPTNDRTIHKTLEIAENIRKECGQDHLLLTYDLAMAKPAYKIQIDCAPKFDALFINLGPFHVELTFFKAIGKVINESGIPRIFVSSELISEGSLSGVISGKHFNRCKKTHIIASLAFKVLHFKTFLQEYERNTENNNDLDITEILDLVQHYNTTDDSLSKLSGFCNKYQSYLHDTLNGSNGKTAQFVAHYSYMIDLYLLYEAALRTSNVDLFIFISHKMCAYFFELNHPNYARYLTRNIDNLANIDSTHPGLTNQLQSGALSIRRTTKNFARNPVDLTLEQTINANAANKLTGISAFTNSISTRNKWAETHSTRMAIIRDFYEFIGFIKKQDICDTPHENRNFKRKVTKFIKTVEDTFNPFDKEITQSHLFNVTTGKAASNKTAEFLLNLEANGIKKMEKFASECKENVQRFEKPITRAKILNFATEMSKPKQVTHLSNKINAVETEKFIIGRLLVMAIENKINLNTILSFPLTNVPYSLAQFDGTINLYHSTKDISTLFQKERNLIHKDDLNIGINVINGIDYMLSLNDAPNTYGKLALLLLKRLCESNSLEIHIFFDGNETNMSIRNYEEYKKKQLYEDNAVFEIAGFNQERNCSLKKSLMKSAFRKTMVEFVLKTWKEHEEVSAILKNKRVFVSYGDQCYLFSKNFDKMKPINIFTNNHINVESRMILHISKMSAQNILVQIQNADLLLITLLFHMQHLPEDVNVYIETGNSNKNTSNLIDVRQIFKDLSKEFISSLPAWYIFTGNAYEPCFFGKGKKGSFKLLQKNEEYRAAFSKLGSSINVDSNFNSVIESLTCRMYNSNKDCVNAARVEIFENILSQQNRGNERGNIYLLAIDVYNLLPIPYIFQVLISKRCHHRKKCWKTKLKGRII